MKKDDSWRVKETIKFEDLHSDWEYPTEFPELSKADIISIDTETCDPGLSEFGPGWTRGEGNVAGISIAARFGTEVFSGYYPIGHGIHGRDGNMDRAMVTDWLRRELKSNTHKVYANANYDMGWLSTENIETVDYGRTEDIQIMAPLINEHMWSYSLDTLGKYYLKESKDEALLNLAIGKYGLKHPKKEMWKLHPKFVGPYAEQDAILTLKLYEHFNPLIDKDPVSGQSLRQVYDLETKLIPILFKMQRRGIRVDVGRAEKVKEEFQKQIAERQKWLNTKAGFEINVNSGDDLGRACDDLGIEYPRTAKTNKPSFTKDFIEFHDAEFLREVRKVRQMMKAQSTFIESAILNKVHNGRVHPQFHQLRRSDDQNDALKGTISGRFSCTTPNIQQVSSRDEVVAPLIRQIFLPEEDTLWGSFDYSSQEPRHTVHKAAQLYRAGVTTYWLDHLAKSEDAVRKYHEDPKTDYHQMVADLCGISRKEAKTINLGIAYGMGGAKLCKSLGLPTEMRRMFGKMIEMAGPEGQEILDKYHAGAAYIKGLSKFCEKFAKDNGYIRTELGRHARFNDWTSTDFDTARKTKPEPFETMRAYTRDPENPLYGHSIERAKTYVAMNRVVQGSSADQTKLAMLQCYEAGYLPLAQVHDELAIPISIVNKEQQGQEVKEIMENCMPLIVPSLVDYGLGRTWGDAKG